MMSVNAGSKIMKMTDAKQQFSSVVGDVFRTRRRVLVEKGGIPVAAIVTAADFERLNRLDAERAADFAIFREVGQAFADVDPDELQREVDKAVAEVRTESRAAES